MTDSRAPGPVLRARPRDIVYNVNIPQIDGLFSPVAIAPQGEIGVKPRKRWEKTVLYPLVTASTGEFFTGGTATGQ